MKKLCFTLGLASLLALGMAHGKDDAPRGFTPLAEFSEAGAKATEDQKLLVVVIKGADDNCPRCTNALETGEKAVGSGVVKVFGRAEAVNIAANDAFPPAIKERFNAKFPTGASVCFLVFNPDGTKLLAEASRMELDDNKDGTAEFKKAVKEAKRDLKD